MPITEADKQMMKNLTPKNLAKFLQAMTDLHNAKHYTFLGKKYTLNKIEKAKTAIKEVLESLKK